MLWKVPNKAPLSRFHGICTSAIWIWDSYPRYESQIWDLGFIQSRQVVWGRNRVRHVPFVEARGVGDGPDRSPSFPQVMALADAVEENQASVLQAFSRLRSATHLLLLLVGLWQKLSADQMAILEAAFLPLQHDTQELVRPVRLPP